jgi:glycosyltransferase involved in cell wall biosynthesis
MAESSTSTALPRKVLHVLNSAGGGAALSTLSLMESLRAAGIDCCAVCHDAGSKSERERLRDVARGEVLFTPLYWWNRKIRAKTWKRPLLELRQLWRTGWTRKSSALVAEFAKQHQADLIHSNTVVTLEGGLAAKQTGLPHVWHVRELVGRNMAFPLGLEKEALGKYLAAHATKLVANSHVSASLLEPWLPQGLMEIVPNGIDISRFKVTERPADVRPLVVGMVASLTSRTKNHPLFLQAASLVDRSLPIEWRIYGHDPSQGGAVRGDAYTDALHGEIGRLNIGDRFHLLGFRDDPAQIMSEIDILVHPAGNESFGRIVVEAMAAGLPVVGVASGGVGEIVQDGETGLLAQPDQPQQLADLVERLVRDPALRQEMGSAGRALAIGRYSLEAYATGIQKVYALAMEKSRRAIKAGRAAEASSSGER